MADQFFVQPGQYFITFSLGQEFLFGPFRTQLSQGPAHRGSPQKIFSNFFRAATVWLISSLSSRANISSRFLRAKSFYSDLSGLNCHKGQLLYYSVAVYFPDYTVSQWLISSFLTNNRTTALELNVSNCRNSSVCNEIFETTLILIKGHNNTKIYEDMYYDDFDLMGC